jgi:hypothetical protein
MLPVSVLTTIALAGCLRSGSIVERCLSAAPLAGLGVISYSLYLVHWPVLVLSGAASPPAVMRAVAVSVAISIVLHRLVERPAMSLPLGRRTLVACASATAIVGASVLAFAPAGQRDVLAELQIVADRNGADGPNPDAALAPPPTSPSQSSTAAPTSTAPSPATAPSATTAPPTSAGAATVATMAPPRPPPTLGFIGDSVALSLALAASSQRDPTLYRPAKGSVELGCGLARFESTSAIELDCADPVDRVAALAPGSIEVAVVVSCQWQLLDRRIPGHSGKLDVTDPAFQDYVYAEYLRVADALVASGVDTVLWGICAPMSQVVGVDHLPRRYVASRSTERGQALAAVIRRVAEARPAVETIDLGRIVDGRVDDATLRPDGNHFEWKRDVGVAAAFNALVRCALVSECAASDASVAIH